MLPRTGVVTCAQGIDELDQRGVWRGYRLSARENVAIALTQPRIYEVPVRTRVGLMDNSRERSTKFTK